jgi:hypothetical protein
MIAFITASLAIVLAIVIVRWVAAVPLLRTLSASIDNWADGVQGEGAEPLR